MKRLREQVFKLSATDDLDTKTLIEVSSIPKCFNQDDVV